MVKLCVRQLKSFPYNLLYDKQWKNATRFCMTFRAIQFSLTPLNFQAFTVCQNSQIRVLRENPDSDNKGYREVHFTDNQFLLDIR